MRLISAVMLVLFCNPAWSQAELYSAFTIPDSLRKSAHVVVRRELQNLVIKDLNTAKHEISRITTILTEEGKDELEFGFWSSKFRYLDDAEITVYNSLGQKVKNYTRKDMSTVNYGEGLVPEGKYTYINLPATSWPITIEQRITYKFRGILNLPSFVFQQPWHSLEQSSYRVEVPADLGFRYKILNCNYQPTIEQKGKYTVYNWELKNLPVFKRERRTGSFENSTPMVFLAPNRFQLDDYEGDMTSWQNFGKWINDLYAKTTQLPEERKNYFREMVKSAATNREKAEILYHYLQTNMRYVSIQLGIGGFRPSAAEFVDEKKYGDCKALSNYMKSALDAVGIKSNVVIIEAGNHPSPVYDDFPANYFNHVILCMPQAKDTVWLECTSRSLPFGYLSPFTENRKAMLVTEEGGKLVSTPISKFTDNSLSFHTTITVDADVFAKVDVKQYSRGDFRNDMIASYQEMKEEDKKRFIIQTYSWKQPDLLNIAGVQGRPDPYQIRAEMEYEKVYSFKAGSKYFFSNRLYQILNEDIPDNPARKSDFHFDFPYEVMDTTVYVFPAGFTIENIPQNKDIKFPFAGFTSRYELNKPTNSITIISSLQLKQRIVKAADYTRLMEFRKQVVDDSNEKIVLKKS